MESPQTCGQGLAEQSALPAALAGLMDSVATILEHHMKSLDLADEKSKRELEAYRQLANEHRDVAQQMRTTAGRMRGYRDLPMGRHDPALMATPAAADAFEGFVTLEQDLVTLLEKRLRQDRQMLDQMRAAAGAP